MIFISSPLRVRSPSYSFWGKLGDQEKGSFTEKGKILARQRAGIKLQYGRYFVSVACS